MSAFRGLREKEHCEIKASLGTWLAPVKTHTDTHRFTHPRYKNMSKK